MAVEQGDGAAHLEVPVDGQDRGRLCDLVVVDETSDQGAEATAVGHDRLDSPVLQRKGRHRADGCCNEAPRRAPRDDAVGDPFGVGGSEPGVRPGRRREDDRVNLTSGGVAQLTGFGFSTPSFGWSRQLTLLPVFCSSQIGIERRPRNSPREM